VIGALAALLLCQLAGEALARAFALPIPGPVIGMALLFAALLARGRPEPAPLGRTADALLTHLGLLFVPAGVGVVLHLPALSRDAAPIGLAVLGGTLATIGLTGWLAQRWLRR
jgi:holin-like protein